MEKKTFYACERMKILGSRVDFSYFNSCKNVVKKFKPVSIGGERYKLNVDTGEFRPYHKSEVICSISDSVSRSKQFLFELLDCNTFDWFITLTFDEFAVDRMDDEAVYEAYCRFMNNLSHLYPSLQYVTVPESHKNGAIHFHIMLGGMTPKELGLTNSGKVCCSWSTKNGVCSAAWFERTKANRILTPTDGLPIYNVSCFPYGYSTATIIVSRERCNWYVQKYLDKGFGSTAIFKKRFFYSKNLNRPYSHTDGVEVIDYWDPYLHSRGVIQNEFASGEYHNREFNMASLSVLNEDFDKMNNLLVLEHNAIRIPNDEMIFDLEDVENG